MAIKYESIHQTPLSQAILDMLVEKGYLLKINEPVVTLDMDKLIKKKWTGPKHEYKRNETSGIGFCDVCLSDDKNDGNHLEDISCTANIDKFLNNHLPIESNIETIAKENLGICEDRKEWLKNLKAAVKEYGHDSVLESFYEWSLAQGNFIGRRPVTSYLKNISNNIGLTSRKKPTVTNPSLTKVEERIAYITDNKVFFTGDFRVKLAGLLKDFGPELVIKAFEDFFQDVDDRGIPFAARDFLQRAEVMIRIIMRKKAESDAQAKLIADSYTLAQESVQSEEEEEEPEL